MSTVPANDGYKELAEIFSLWLPFLSQGCCDSCCDLIQKRVQSVQNLGLEKLDPQTVTNCDTEYYEDSKDYCSPSSGLSNGSPEILHERSDGIVDEHYARRGNVRHLSSIVVSKKSSSNLSTVQSWREKANKDDVGAVVQTNNREDSANYEINKEIRLSRDEIEEIRFKKVGRKKDFVYRERVDGRMVNIVKGLELHTRVFNRAEQKKIVDYVYKLQDMGREGLLKERTYSEPRKWMRGKGRATIQFGCCYNYAEDKNGNPPGIIQDEDADPIPTLFKTIIKRLVRWHVLPKTCIPNSCIVNIYDKGDCIPPHIDHHDFVRPFCTVSFLTEANIVFGTNLKIAAAGEFLGPVTIPLPVGSVLVLKGNGADVAKHCVPSVPAKRISITFRKMDDRKLPYGFKPDPNLEGMQPFAYPSSSSPGLQASVVRLVSYLKPHVQQNQQPKNGKREVEGETRDKHNEFHLGRSPNKRRRTGQYSPRQ